MTIAMEMKMQHRRMVRLKAVWFVTSTFAEWSTTLQNLDSEHNMRVSEPLLCSNTIALCCVVLKTTLNMLSDVGTECGFQTKYVRTLCV